MMNDPVMIALIVAIPPTVAAVAAFRQSKDNGKKAEVLVKKTDGNRERQEGHD